jgi:hypothetical protein
MQAGICPRRKKRTREHIMEDLSVNHVERQALLCGHSVERIYRDYGIDLVMFTHAADGEVESGQVFLQVKATDKLKLRLGGKSIAFRVE